MLCHRQEDELVMHCQLLFFILIIINNNLVMMMMIIMIIMLIIIIIIILIIITTRRSQKPILSCMTREVALTAFLLHPPWNDEHIGRPWIRYLVLRFLAISGDVLIYPHFAPIMSIMSRRFTPSEPSWAIQICSVFSRYPRKMHITGTGFLAYIIFICTSTNTTRGHHFVASISYRSWLISRLTIEQKTVSTFKHYPRVN